MKRRKVFLLIAFFLVVGTAGYLSNVVTQDDGQYEIANRILHTFELEEAYVMPSFPKPGISTFRAAGVRLYPCNSGKAKAMECFPYADIGETKTLTPFLVSIEWSCVEFPTSGEGRRTTFICLFGKAIRIFERSRWVS